MAASSEFAQHLAELEATLKANAMAAQGVTPEARRRAALARVGQGTDADRMTPEMRELAQINGIGEFGQNLGSMAAEATTLPQAYRTGTAIGHAVENPSLETVTNAGARAALTAFRPLAAAKMLGAGYGVAGARDAGLLGDAQAAGSARAKANLATTTPGPAGSLPGLSPEEATELGRLRGRDLSELSRRDADVVRGRIRQLEQQSSDFSRSRNASTQDEFNRQVKTAEMARDAELARDTRFSDTNVGRMWSQTGALTPALAGFAAGAIGRAASGGGSVLKNYVGPAAEGAIAGGLTTNIPLAGDAFFTPADNPQRRAYDAYARELPATHPEKERWSTYAQGLPTENPIRSAAASELYDPRLAGERLGFGALEGIGGGLLGAGAVRLPGAIAERAAAFPARLRQSYAQGLAPALEAERNAAGIGNDIALGNQRAQLSRMQDGTEQLTQLADQRRRLQGQIEAPPVPPEPPPAPPGGSGGRQPTRRGGGSRQPQLIDQPPDGQSGPIPYDYSIHSPISQRTIADMYRPGEPIPSAADISRALRDAYSSAGTPLPTSQSRTPRVNATRSAMTGLETSGLPPDARREALGSMLGRAPFLSLPAAAGAGAAGASLLSPPADASLPPQDTRSMMPPRGMPPQGLLGPMPSAPQPGGGPQPGGQPQGQLPPQLQALVQAQPQMRPLVQAAMQGDPEAIQVLQQIMAQQGQGGPPQGMGGPAQPPAGGLLGPGR